MRTALLQYPPDCIVKTLTMILEKKGFTIVSVDAHKGIIKAQTKKSIFEKSASLALKALKLGKDVVRVDCWMNTPQSHKGVGLREEKLLNAVCGYF